jgi:hypothetical protein
MGLHGGGAGREIVGRGSGRIRTARSEASMPVTRLDWNLVSGGMRKEFFRLVNRAFLYSV